MYENISGMKIQGGLFRKETSLEFFHDSRCNVLIILGRNGSGKSTISRAINDIKKGTGEFFKTNSFIDYDKQFITLKDDERENICVFNENYIQDNINIEERALGNIAIIGKQNICKDEIERINQEIERLLDEEKKANAICEKYDNDDGELSVNKHLSNIFDILKSNGGWAERGKNIEGLSTKKKVNMDILRKILEHSNEEALFNLNNDYNEKMAYYHSIARADVEKLPRINLPTKVDVELLMKLLAVKLEQAHFSEREEYLFNLASGTIVKHAEMVMRVLDESQSDVCPFCLRHIDKSLKDELLIKISNILSEKVKEHEEQLKKSIINVEEINMDKYAVLKTDASNFSSLLGKYNMQIKYINELIKHKLDYIYKPIVDFEDNISDIYENLIKETENINLKIDEYNNDIIQIEDKRNELKEINFKIAYHEIKDSYSNYHKLKENQKNAHKTLKDCQKHLNDKKEELARKKAELKNIKIAVEIINKNLVKIFFDKNRIRLCLNEDEYYSIYSNGECVSPNQVSVGERNIIALCYFFTELLDGRVENEAYKETYFLVIDDPISSFDYENKIGIYTFLRGIMEKLVNDNMNTKIIFLTHDVQAFYALKQIMSDISLAKNRFCVRELKNGCITEVKYNQRNEYSELLKMAFNFACEAGNYKDNELFIGNVLRRVVESFSTFSYKLGIDKISTDESVLSKIQDEEFREYYKDLMYRLLLHGDSHMEENMRAIPLYGFEENFDIRTKVRIAKEIIVFLYLLDSVHVERHIGDCKCAKTINVWKNEIKERLN